MKKILISIFFLVSCLVNQAYQIGLTNSNLELTAESRMVDQSKGHCIKKDLRIEHKTSNTGKWCTTSCKNKRCYEFTYNNTFQLSGTIKTLKSEKKKCKKWDKVCMKKLNIMIKISKRQKLQNVIKGALDLIDV